MRMGERIKDNFNRYSISGPTFVASGIIFREQVLFLYRRKKKSCVYCNMPKKKNWVGRSGFFFNSNVYVWFSLCFKSAILYP